MKNLLVLLSVFACLVAANGSFRGSLKDFLNRGPTQVRVETPQKSIAVVVNGGDEEADSVADKCGVLNQGQVAMFRKYAKTYQRREERNNLLKNVVLLYKPKLYYNNILFV